MNEQFQKYLMDILEKTGEFLGNEVPEVAQQILTFSAYSCILHIVTLSCAISVFLYGCHSWDKFTKTWDCKEDALGARAVAKVARAVIFVIFIYKVFGQLSTLIKIYVAPKVFLLEYASDLIK